MPTRSISEYASETTCYNSNMLILSLTPRSNEGPRALFVALLASSLLLAACKKKEVPEVLRDRQRREAIHKKRLALIKKGKLKPSWTRPDNPQAAHGKKKPHRDKSQPHQAKGDLPVRTSALPLEIPDDHKWPKSLKLELLGLLKAPPQRVPALSLKMAYYGPIGYEALRFVVRQTTQPKTKRASCSFLIAQGHMFRPTALARMGREALLPYLQRAAIDTLGELKDKESQALLRDLAEKEKPMARFIAAAMARPGVTFDPAQIQLLDTLLNPKDLAALKKTLLGLSNFELEKGLFMILRSRVSRPTYQALIAKRLVWTAAQGDRERLRDYARGLSNPPILRVGAAQALMASKDPKDQKAIRAILSNPKDPMARSLQRRMAKGHQKATQ